MQQGSHAATESPDRSAVPTDKAPLGTDTSEGRAQPSMAANADKANDNRNGPTGRNSATTVLHSPGPIGRSMRGPMTDHVNHALTIGLSKDRLPNRTMRS